MTSVTRIFEDGGYKYVEVLVENCCQNKYLFKILKNGNFYDIAKCEVASIGMTDSIRKAVAIYNVSTK